MNTINFKKNKESIRFFIIIFFFVGGYAFFFSSMYWMPASVDASYLTKVGIENTWNNRHITITRWDYSEEQGVMEVELSVENKSYDGKNTYDFSAVDLRGRKLTIDTQVTDTDWIVLQIKDIPNKWSDISLRMEVAGEDKERLKLYTNINDVNKVKRIKSLNRIGYLQKRFESEICNYKKGVEHKQGEIKILNQEITEVKKEIERLTEAKLYQTEKQKQESDTLIADAQSTIFAKEKNINTLHGEIEEINRRIEMKEKQKKDLMN